MIYRGGKLVLEIQKNVLETIGEILQRTQKNIGAVYKGALLVWLTVYNAVKHCFNTGTWLGDRQWFGDDTWKNN